MGDTEDDKNTPEDEQRDTSRRMISFFSSDIGLVKKWRKITLIL